MPSGFPSPLSSRNIAVHFIINHSMSLNPKTKALHEAVAGFCDKSKVNSLTIATITEKFVGLLASRWEHICDVAHDEDSEGKAEVGVKIKLDLSHKAPVGVVALGFSVRTRDEAPFNVGDPDQETLPLDGGANPPPRRRRGRRPRATVVNAEEAASRA